MVDIDGCGPEIFRRSQYDHLYLTYRLQLIAVPAPVYAFQYKLDMLIASSFGKDL